MADLIKPGQPEDTEHLEPVGVDSELDIKAVVWIGAVLAGITVASFILMWFLYVGLISWSEDHDPEPYALRELRPAQPPGPALQTSPETGTPEDELRLWQEGQRTLLEGSPVLLDEDTARIPIDLAMAAVVEQRARRAEIGGAVDELLGDPEMDDREMPGFDVGTDPMGLEAGGPIPLSIQQGERQRAALRAEREAREEALGPVIEIGGEPAVATEETEGMASAMTDTYEEPVAGDSAADEEEGADGADGAPPPQS